MEILGSIDFAAGHVNLALIVTLVLVVGVIFVNGWTDAPNAIATAISTRVLKPRTAIWMAVVMNFLGVVVMTFLNATVAETISNIADFGSDQRTAQIALAASLFAIVFWAVASWYYAIPTSESHALIAGLTGSAMALSGLDAINMSEWSKVLFGLVFSTTAGFIGGYVVVRLIEKFFRHTDRRKANKIFNAGQAIAAAGNAFLHGAQDGQKFMGVFMLGLSYNGFVDNVSGGYTIPMEVMIVCSLIMGFGTSVGGMKIIKSVGMDMVKLETYQGFSADLSAVITLFICSWTGIPVSTTHTKTTAIMGVGAAKRMSSVNWSIVGNMVLAWVLTFPGAGIIAYVMAKVFLMIF